VTHPAEEYVLAVPLPDAGPQLESLQAPISFGDGQEAVVVGAQLAEFSPRVPAAQRAALTDCLLLAQLAANKATAGKPDLMAWYRTYVEVLQGIGWTVQTMNLEERQLDNLDAGVHRAIVPVIAAMLGPVGAAASMVLGVLNGLQEMDKDNPWITVFDRASQHSSGAKFQFGFVDVGADSTTVSIKLLALAIDASRTITQVLFFKFSKQDAKLRTADGLLGIDGTRLDSIKDALAARVQPFLVDNISKIDI
jgi:hypothetical protein